MKKIFTLLTLALLFTATAFADKEIKRPDTYNYNRAMEEISNENYDEAMTYLQKEIEADKKNGYAYFWVSVLQMDKGANGYALSNINTAIKLLPKKDKDFLCKTYFTRAAIYLELKDTVNALNDYQTAINAMPDETRPYSQRAQLYYEMKQYDLSDNDYRQVVRLDQSEVLGYMGLGRNCMKREQWDEAIEQFTTVINMYSDYDDGYAFRAEAYIGKQKWSDAADDIIKALALSHSGRAFNTMIDNDEKMLDVLKAKIKLQQNKEPNDSYWPYLMGIVHEDLDIYDKALEYYDASLKLEEGDPVVYHRIASCYSNMDMLDKSIEYIDKALEVDSLNLSYNLFKAEMLSAKGCKEEAIALFDDIVTANPEESDAYYGRAAMKLYARNLDDAIEDLTMAQTLAPEASGIYSLRGDAYMMAGKKELALDDYRKVIELESSDVKLYTNIYYAYQALGDNDKAIEALNAIRERDGEGETVYYNMACLYSRMHDKAKALEALQKSMDLGYSDFRHMERDYDMDFLRDTEEFKAMVSKQRAIIHEKYAGNADEGSEVSTKEAVTTEVPFVKDGGVCNVKCKINDLPLSFIFDTGASTVSISMVEATFMMKNGYISNKDVVGKQGFMDANGNVSVGTIINLKKVEFGGLTLENVRASVVANQKAPLLLGQSVLSRLGKIEIDNAKRVLRITSK